MNPGVTARLPSTFVSVVLLAIAVLGWGARGSGTSTAAHGATPRVDGAILARAGAEIVGRVQIEVRHRSRTGGMFEIRGAIAERGSMTSKQRVMAGRLQLTATLRGASGTIRIRVLRKCSASAGTWRAISGSGSYAEIDGGGTTHGGPRCGVTRYPVRSIHSGRVHVPEPPAPAPPVFDAGRYGGGTSQREEIVFDVESGGRTVVGLRLVVMAPCTGSATPRRRVFVSLAGPHEIARDGTFAVRVESWWSGSVTGRFTSRTTAEGTAEVLTRDTDSAGVTTTCSATVTWHASLPPPSASPGTYCGSTSQGQRVCVDVGPDGRQVTRAEVGITTQRLASGQCDLKLRFGVTAIGGNLGFSGRTTSIEGATSGEGGVGGRFEPNGREASGSVFLAGAGLEEGGRRYACRSTSATWQATR